MKTTGLSVIRPFAILLTLIPLTLVPASSAAGQEILGIEITPEFPRVSDSLVIEFEAVVGCAEELLPAEVAGNVIRLTLERPCLCPPGAPIQTLFRSEVPGLLPGPHRIEIQARDVGECAAVTQLAEKELIVTTVGRIRDLSLHPPKPTTDDEIRLDLSLDPENPFFYFHEVSGDLIRIIGTDIPITPPPYQSFFSFDLGSLAAGEYQVLVEGDLHVSSGSFVDFVLPFTVAPAPTEELGLADRYRVTAHWRSPGFGAGEGQATAQELTDRSGYFWFFQEDNVELVVKVLDGCDVNGFVWVFASGMTNVGVEIFVDDLETGERRHYFDPVDAPFKPIQDVRAFSCS